MLKLNKKGFTLVEVLAVVVILGIIMLIAIPNVSSLINKNKIDSCKKLKENIISATKTYFSDYRYKISVDTDNCSNAETADIISINGFNLINSKFPINKLIENGYLKGKSEIENPANGSKIDTKNTYVTVKYNCTRKDYDFSIDDNTYTDFKCQK